MGCASSAHATGVYRPSGQPVASRALLLQADVTFAVCYYDVQGASCLSASCWRVLCGVWCAVCCSACTV
jgi:hypothetical protein